MRNPALKPNKEYIILGVIFIVALLLRLYRLGANDYWWDEVNSIKIADVYAKNWNPPLYFMLLNYWIKMFGTSEFNLRFLSLIFSVMSVPLLYLLGRRLFNARVGIIASLMMSLSSFHLWYAQEVRPYTLSALLSIMSTYFLYRAATEGKNKLWIMFIISSALALYSNITYFHFFLLLAQIFLAVILFKRKYWTTLLYFLAVVCIFLPHIPKFIDKLQCVKEGFWILMPLSRSLLITIENFNLGYTMPDIAYRFSLLISLLLIIGAVLWVRGEGQQRRKEFIFVLLLAALPILLIFVVSRIWIPIYLDRGLLIFSPYYYMLLAIGIESLTQKWVKDLIVTVFLVLLLVSLNNYYRNLLFTPEIHHTGAHLKKPYRPAIKFLESNAKEGEIVAHTNVSSWEVFEFYSGKKEMFLYAPGMEHGTWRKPYNFFPETTPIADIDRRHFQGLWLVISDWERSGNPDENSQVVKDWLDKKLKLDVTQDFAGLKIVHYVRE